MIYATDTRTLEGIVAKDYDLYLIEANYENEEELRARAENDYYFNRVITTHLSKEEASQWLLENMNDDSIFEYMHQHKNKEEK